MNKADIEMYVNKIYAYCIKRTADIEDAKDLSQEIICEALRAAEHIEIKSFEAWLWKVAHNRYARYVAKKKRHYSIYENEFAAASIDDFYEFENADDYQLVFQALHSIAKSHRDLLIDKYVNELTTTELSVKYNLPEGTVKTRLYYGREKLKERWNQMMEKSRIYERINWFISGNGNIDISYVERQLSRAIIKACYEKPLNIEEISAVTGVPCLYIEDEIPNLLYGEILKANKGRYLANIIVHSEETTNAIENMLLNRRKQMANATRAILESSMPLIREIGFHGCDFPNSRLWWFIVPIVWREACEQARRLHRYTDRGDFPPRIDGGSGWVIVNEIGSERHKYFSGCNGYFIEESKFYYYWSSKYFSEDLNMFLFKLENTEVPSGDFSACGFSDALSAGCIKYGLVKNSKWQIPVFNAVQHRKFMEIVRNIAEPLSKLIYPTVDEIYKLICSATPKRLHEQIKGVFGAELNSIIAMICDEMEQSGLLEIPNDEYFTGQIILVLA